MSEYIYLILNNNDKIEILKARIKNNESLIYGTKINILEYQAQNPIDQSLIDFANQDIENCLINIGILKGILAEIEAN